MDWFWFVPLSWWGIYIKWFGCFLKSLVVLCHISLHETSGGIPSTTHATCSNTSRWLLTIGAWSKTAFSIWPIFAWAVGVWFFCTFNISSVIWDLQLHVLMLSSFVCYTTPVVQLFVSSTSPIKKGWIGWPIRYVLEPLLIDKFCLHVLKTVKTV